MTDKRDAPKASRGGRQFPPTALEVPECPPHRWFIEGKWQECRKCGARMEVPQPAPAQPSRNVRKEAPAEQPAAETAGKEVVAAEAGVESPTDVEAEAETEPAPDEVGAVVDVTNEPSSQA